MQTLKERVNKYAAKIIGDVVKNRIDSGKDIQIERYKNAMINIMKVDAIVRKITKENKRNIMLNPFYMSFGRQVQKILRKYSGKTAEDEVDIVFFIWTKRGLDEEILKKIRAEINEAYK